MTRLLFGAFCPGVTFGDKGEADGCILMGKVVENDKGASDDWKVGGNAENTSHSKRSAALSSREFGVQL